MKAKFFRTPSDFRTWLEKHHARSLELLVGFYKRESGKPSITWHESVGEALCFGWIDGVRKRVDEMSYTVRFTPRKPGSTWSTVNIERVKTLAAQAPSYRRAAIWWVIGAKQEETRLRRTRTLIELAEPVPGSPSTRISQSPRCGSAATVSCSRRA